MSNSKRRQKKRREMREKGIVVCQYARFIPYGPRPSALAYEEKMRRELDKMYGNHTPLTVERFRDLRDRAKSEGWL